MVKNVVVAADAVEDAAVVKAVVAVVPEAEVEEEVVSTDTVAQAKCKAVSWQLYKLNH